MVRAAYLRKHPLCEDCWELGLTVAAKMVHHMVAISDGGEAYDEGNLRALCIICHGKYAEKKEIVDYC